LDEAYQRKQTVAALGDVDARLDLAHWCVQHGLYGYSARELAIASRVDPRNPRIALLLRHIEVEQSAPQPRAIANAAERNAAAPSDQELERLWARLPPSAVESFRLTVQPLLLNACATSGCHTDQSRSAFHLSRVPLDRSASRRQTLLNLFATVAQVDRDKVQDSKLLTMAISPHGGMPNPPLTRHQIDQLRVLLGWSRQIAARDPSPPLDAAAMDAGASLHADAFFGAAHGAATTARPTFSPTVVDATAETAPAATQPRQAARPREQATHAPQNDPFDASAFNRRYHAPSDSAPDDEPTAAEEPEEAAKNDS
jgi:hypothetical protein